jgi:hypothetical protein
MSLTCEMLLLTNCDANDPPMLKLRAWCEAHAGGQQFEPIKMDSAGGRRFYSDGVWACCGNYFPWKELVEVFPLFGSLDGQWCRTRSVTAC